MKKITPSQAIKVIQGFKRSVLDRENWFININPYIKAILLYGSVAKGTNRLDSGIDILIMYVESLEGNAPQKLQ